jgi:hypothetical protein
MLCGSKLVQTSGTRWQKFRTRRALALNLVKFVEGKMVFTKIGCNS